jgi:hypothetical protein
MLDLQSPRWKELSQAYGSAENISALLAQLKTAAPKKDYRSEPWFSLWSSLCHQDDVYTASYAAVPHFIGMVSHKPLPQRVDFLLISASIEAQRHTKRAPKIPEDLNAAYLDALRTGDSLALECLSQNWSEPGYRVLFGALAIFRGEIPLGNMLLNFDGDCQCPNCEAIFPPLGYDILKEK